MSEMPKMLSPDEARALVSNIVKEAEKKADDAIAGKNRWQIYLDRAILVIKKVIEIRALFKK